MTQISGKRLVFLGVILLLVAAIVVASAVILVRGPRESPVEVLENQGETPVHRRHVRGEDDHPQLRYCRKRLQARRL